VLTTDVCGYAPHIETADAGTVLQSPFRQEELNRQLSNMLTNDKRHQWSTNGRRYGENMNLYRMPETAANVIELWTRDKKEQSDISLVEIEKGIRLYLRQDFRHNQNGRGSFNDIMAMTGEIIREAPGRQTKRFELENKTYFLKIHTGVGWQEIIKNLVYFRLPVLGATNEWHGIHWIQRLGIKTLSTAGYGTTSGNPAKLRSFIITDEIDGAISLEDFCQGWKKRPPRTSAEFMLKRKLIQRIAEIARVMHTSGANHRDFYLCHFLLKTNELHNIQKAYTQCSTETQKTQAISEGCDALNLHLIDLHRMQLRRKTPSRWVIKDIAGLYYSAIELPLTQRDLFRFMKEYRMKPLRQILKEEKFYWHRVESKALNLYATEARRAQRRALTESRSASYTA
jgi:hypothetical protein